MDKERWGGEEDAFEQERLNGLREKDHKILSLFEIIKEGEEKLLSIQETQYHSPPQETLPEMNCSFLLEILHTLKETVHDSMVTNWDSDERIEILPEIFFYQTSEQETPSLKRIFENLARLFRDDAPTSKFFQTPHEKTDVKSLLSDYKRKQFDKVIESQKENGRKRGKNLSPEHNRELLLVQEKCILLADIITNLNTKKLLPQSGGEIPLTDIFFILADLIEEQAEFLTEM